MTPDIQATNRLFEQEVVAKRNFDALDKVYTADARILPPGADMISGVANIKAFWKAAVEGMNVATCQLESVDLDVQGDKVIEIGRANLNPVGGGSVAVKYVVIWKQEGGVWKWHIDIWNPNA